MTGRRGFTLGEVIVVIVCLGILTGLLLPVLFQTRQVPRYASCKNSLRQVGIALRLYADEFENAFPTVEDVPPAFDTEPGHTVQALQLLCTLNYTDNPKIFSCPSLPSSHNDFMPGGALKATSTSYAYDSRHTTKHAGPVIIAGDCQDGTKAVSANHKGDGGNYLAVDGSVQWVRKPNNSGTTKLCVDPTTDDDIWSLGPPSYVHDTCLRRTAK